MEANTAKKRITEIWDSRAPAYDSLHGHGLKTDRERQVWLSLLSRLLPSQKPQRILDIGVGTGFLAFLLDSLGHEVTGLDFSERMLDVAYAKAKQIGSRLNLVIGDADFPPFQEGRFDAVISRAVLWTLVDPMRTIKAWLRVTRPGGLVIAIDGSCSRPQTASSRLVGNTSSSM